MRPLVTLFCFAALLAPAQTVLNHTFDKDTEGWLTMGTNGSVKVCRDIGDVKSGAGSLQFTYSFDGKGVNTAILPVGAGRLAEMRRVRFWVKADHDTSLGVILTEKKPGGGDYAAMFWAPKNVWQRVDLGLSDFIANDGPTDPVDSDGKLDPDQVEGFGIVDFASFFNQMPSESPMVVTKKSGTHSLWIDDFEILSNVATKTNKPDSVVVDGFDRGFTEWITLGGVNLGISPGDNPVGGPALTASIKTVDGKIALMLRRVHSAEIAGTKRLAFDIAADHEGTFAISIETRKPGAGSGQGPRYNFMVYPPDGRKVFRVNVSLADFEHDANSPEDPAGKLEAARIKSIAIGDITALTGGTAGDNKLWIGRIEMLK